MKTKLIKGLRQIQSKYDAFFIDLWGVVHNGIKLHDEAIKVLENINKLNKRFVLISNAPRPSQNVKNFLLKLEMKEIEFDWEELVSNPDEYEYPSSNLKENNLGFKLNGFLELHEVFGIFFIVKNINLSIIYTFVR